MKPETYRKLSIVALYSAAMGILEAAVVVYLRYLYYPDGFVFPLAGFIDPQVLGMEWVREVATIVMLVCIGMLAGKKFAGKFAYFLWSFAVWDIVYYIGLKLFLDWPASLFTWDILFLIPLPWIGPVIAPVLMSLCLMVLAVVILNAQDKGRNVRINREEWILLIVGSAVILYTFMIDYTILIFKGGFAHDFFTLATNIGFMQAVEEFVPTSYNWLLFGIGMIFIISAVILFSARMRRNNRR